MDNGGQRFLVDAAVAHAVCELHTPAMPHGIALCNVDYARAYLPRPSIIADNMPVRQQAHFIREWRKERGLTQSQLAERADVGQPQLSRVENGTRLYDQEFLERLAIAMNVTPADLIMRDPSDPEGLWTIYDQLDPTQRTTLVRMAKVLKGEEEAA